MIYLASVYGSIYYSNKYKYSISVTIINGNLCSIGVQIVVESLGVEELLVCAGFRDPARVHHAD